jgi:hypothetical protein
MGSVLPLCISRELYQTTQPLVSTLSAASRRGSEQGRQRGQEHPRPGHQQQQEGERQEQQRQQQEQQQQWQQQPPPWQPPGQPVPIGGACRSPSLPSPRRSACSPSHIASRKPSSSAIASSEGVVSRRKIIYSLSSYCRHGSC